MNISKPIVHSLFPINLVESNFEFDSSPLIKELYKIQNQNPKGVTISNAGGYQTQDTLQTNSYFLPLVNFIKEVIFKGVNRSSQILNMWGNISPKYCYNITHHHEGFREPSIMSGVAYLQVTKDSGDIVFHSPSDICQTNKFTPTNKCMLLFPQNLIHSVNPNNNDQDRISVAFNVKIL